MNSNKRKPSYTISPGTGNRLLVGGLPVPPPPEVPPPLPPKRTTSLMGTCQRMHIPREVVTLNPKRISIATSTFWEGHPDMPHFVRGWELGRERVEQSVWGEEKESECNIWGDPPAVKKGVLLQQRERLWSRWKERFFILTRDYLHCFRRTTSVHRSGVRLSDMGSFIFKLRLAEIEDVEWENRRSGPMIALVLPQESRILLRVLSDNYESLHQWYTLLQECIYTSKERRRALREIHNPSSVRTKNGSLISKKSQGSPSTTASSKSNSTFGDNSSGNASPGKEKSNRKNSQSKSRSQYSPLLDEEDDEDYVDEEALKQFDQVVRRKERSTMTLNDFMNNPWRQGGGTSRSRSSIATGYSIPVDTRTRPRPESWCFRGDAPPLFRSPTMIQNLPNPWIHQRPINSPGTYGRCSTLFAPSRHTSEITFFKKA